MVISVDKTIVKHTITKPSSDLELGGISELMLDHDVRYGTAIPLLCNLTSSNYSIDRIASPQGMSIGREGQLRNKTDTFMQCFVL